MPSDRFTEPFLAAFGKWIDHVVPFLEIRDWTIVLSDGPPDGVDAAAMVDCEYGKKRANLHLALDFFTFPADRQEHYLLHELAHIVNDGTWKVIHNSSLSQLLGMPAWTVFEANYRQAMEVETDTWAEIIEGLFADGKIYRKLFDEMLAAEKAPAS